MRIILPSFAILNLVLSSFTLFAESRVECNLSPYEVFLESGTYDNQDWSAFQQIPKSRYETFKTAFELIETIPNPTIVELGTSRSFNHGGLIGCNSDDISYWMPEDPSSWDWGAGFFTRMAAVGLNHINPTIYTLDLIRSHINRCRIMTSDFSNIHYIVSDSITFLSNCDFPNGIQLLYLDTGDMTPIEPTAQLQLEEAKIIVKRNLVADGG